MPVGEWLGGDMIRCVSGNSVLRSRGLSDRISYRMDTEISPSYPKSWSAGLFAKTFSESDEEPTGVRDSRLQHAGGPYPYDHDHSSEVFCE